MKTLSLVLAALCAICSAPLCAAEDTAAERVLYVYTWEDYFDPSEIEAFERANKCRVEFEYYDSNEIMHEALLLGGGYDVVTPPPHIAVDLYNKSRLGPLNHALLPNMKNLQSGSPVTEHDKRMVYSIPYTVTVTGVGYNRKLTPPDAIGSWAIFENNAIGKNMAMLNDLREALGAALKHLGYSINSTNPDEIRAAGKTMAEWQKNLVLFDVDQAKFDLRDGKLTAIQAYSGDMPNIMRENPDIGFFIPKEGGAINADLFVLPADSRDTMLGHAFINHFLDAGVAARNMAYLGYYMPNEAALEKLDRDTLKSIAFEFPDTCEIVRDLGDVVELYDQVWFEALTGDME